LFSACDQDQAIRLFEVASGLERRILHGHQSEINHVAFSPDNRHFASASADAPIFVWDIWQTSDGPPRTEADRQALWATMTDADAALVFRAMCELLAVPAETVTMIKANLKPEAPLSEQWVSELGDTQFAVRDRAFAELAKIADRHDETLRRVRERSTSAEARRRLQLLIDRADSPSGERLRQVRAVELLERIATPDAVALLRDLAGGAEEAALTRDARDALRRATDR
jgi:hypothetical protein